MIIKFEINGSWNVSELEIFTGSISTLYNIALVMKSGVKVSNLIEFYQIYLDNIREIFDTSLAAEERLRVDHVTMGSPGEGSFAGVNEPVSSLASVIPYDRKNKT